MIVVRSIAIVISSFAKRMTVKRGLFVLLMLALPWQTRWFSDAGLVAGYPWEQGRISVYASWLLLLVFTGVSLWQKRIAWRKPKVVELVLALGLLVPALFSSEPRASFSWLVSVAFAALFAWVIRREQIAIRDLAFWFGISLVPHALLGMFQFTLQFGIDQKWLGLSALNPAIKGTAVILSEGVRYLRAYGGFPHPNIFGGYLAFSLLLFVFSWSSFTERIKKASLVIVPLLSMALAFTASRSAWLAFALGIATFLVTSSKRSDVERSRSPWLAALVPFGLVLAVFPFLVRPVSAPVAGAVEEKSVNERIAALQQVPKLFAHAPILGTGQGGLLPALVQQKLEPLIPHAVPVMVLLETGLWGFVLLAIYLGFLAKGLKEKRLLVALMPILLLDHYLWSYWPGLVLFSILVAFSSYDSTPAT